MSSPMLSPAVSNPKDATVSKKKKKKLHKDAVFSQSIGVTWEEDRVAKTCFGCDKKFSLVLRKHHCRLCGSIFCRKCCSYYVKVDPQTKEIDDQISINKA